MLHLLLESSFYYDTRDCNYYINSDENGAVHCSQDVTFRWEDGSGFTEWYAGTPPGNDATHFIIEEGSTVYLSNVLDEALSGVYSGGDFSCFEADIEIINEYDGIDIGDIVYIADEPVASNEIVALLRGKTETYTSKELIPYSGIDRFHNLWGTPIGNNNHLLLTVTHEPDGDLSIINGFENKHLSTITTATNMNVTISIQDPWYVDGNGNQQNIFHELTNDEYTVFLNEATVPGDASTARYTLLIPGYEVQTTSGRYVFNGWSASGATLAADPTDPNNDLIRKVLFTSEAPSITARYLNLDALQGTVYIDQEWDGDITLTGDLTINSDVTVDLLDDAEVKMAQYKEIKVEGELSANGVTFTRDDPNNNNASYWDWIYARLAGNTYRLHSRRIKIWFTWLPGQCSCNKYYL